MVHGDMTSALLEGAHDAGEGGGEVQSGKEVRSNPLRHEPAHPELQTHPAASESAADLEALVPGLCEGAAGFNVRMCGCCVLFVALPATLLALYIAEDLDNELALLVAAVILFTGCCVVTAYTFAPAASETLKPTTAPPLHGPFAEAKLTPSPQRYDMSDLLGRPSDTATTATTATTTSPHRPLVRSPRKVYLIYNPYGGLGAAKRIVDDIALPTFAARGVAVEVIQTEYAGHPKVLGRTLDLTGYDAMCIVGGDGSCHELVNGLLTREDGQRCVLGFIPAGSGNSVMLDLGTWDPKVATERICNGQTMEIDTIHVTDNANLSLHSVNGVFWGLIGNVAVSAERPFLRKLLGPKRYDAVAVWSVFKKQNFKASVDIDGKRVSDNKEYTTLFVNNTQHFGRALRATPDAYMNDGKIDVCMLEAGGLGIPGQLQVFQQLPTGAHWWNNAIQMQAARHIRLTPCVPAGYDKKQLCNVDGEVCTFTTFIDMKVVPKNVTIYAPREVPPLDPKEVKKKAK